MRVVLHSSARRHGVADDDVLHAYAHAIAWLQLGEDPPRFLVAGPDTAGYLLELVALALADVVLVIHAMPLRRTTAVNLFGPEAS
jgi:hypothetical protein